MSKAHSFAAFDSAAPLAPFTFERREPRDTDVEIEVLYCGVCHSDLHTVRGEWSGTVYPCVPGHEVVGRVTRVGSAVRGFRVGATAAVGCMVDACRECPSCREGLEQYCERDAVTYTYNSPDPHGAGPVTYGGYATSIVVDERFCLRVADGASLPGVAPLLCAGITTYSPLKHWGAGPGKKVGVVGLGGLGHMGVKFAHAFGAHTVLFTTSPGKAEDGRRLGADEVVVSRDADAMRRHAASFDLILDTAAVPHDLDAYTGLLRRDGALVLVGVPEKAHPSPAVGKLIGRRRSIAGSLIGGVRETQEMLDYCAEKGIASEVEVIPMQRIEEAYARMLKGDVKYRFVIDLASLK
ncbi:MAG: Alcohol dehydrogenase, zinc-binding protein [Myxococcaceae bacterium]|nr:Alcohol dehydrogenase, zinc-binding protein [Myxococcaceae bacterium]